jgi:hypothetical protein
LRGHQLLQAGFPAWRQQGFASALVSLGLQRAAFLELLPDPPHGGDTETKKLRNVVSAFALLIEVDDAFADRQWYGPHGDTLPRRHASVKLHVLWNCSKTRFLIELNRKAGKRERAIQTGNFSGRTADNFGGGLLHGQRDNN